MPDRADAAAALFAPLDVRGIRLRNRIAMAPMCQHSAGSDGVATDWHRVHYGARAVGGCGLIMVEDTAVLADGRVSHAGLGLYRDEQGTALAGIASFGRQQGATMGIQLSHAGPRAFRDTLGAGEDLLSVSDEPQETWAAPRSADADDLGAVVSAFRDAAGRAAAAGFDVLEIHGTHGYLVHQFLSPLRNRRTDGYGGSGEARARLLFEIIAAVRTVWPRERVLSLRLPCRDGVVGGLEPADVAALAAACVDRGVDLVALAGGLPPLPEPMGRADLAATARLLVEAGALRVAIGGGVGTGSDAESLLEDSGASLVLVGRPLLADPYWAVRAARELGGPIALPAQYGPAAS